MRTRDEGSHISRIAHTLADIAHTFESSEAHEARVLHALDLLAVLVPYRRCLLLEVLPEQPARLLAVPDAAASERGQLFREQLRILRLLAELDETVSVPILPHLALPVIGLDRIVGILRVDPPEDVSYDVDHLRLLSVVAAQLGAYLTTLYLRDEDRRREKELATANDFQQLLVGTVSHDLRNPLAVVSIMAESLLREQHDALTVRAAGRILGSAHRADRIIHDLLDVTNARTRGGLSIDRRQIDLAVLLEDVVEEARIAHPGRSVQLQIRGDGRATCDGDRMAQAVTNLVRNALQYGDPSGVVTVRLRGADEEAIIQVHNFGPIIPRDVLASISDPFKRPGHKRHREAGGGLGLGLYIVDQIVRAHEGRLEASSSAQEGTMFTIVIPRRLHEAEQPSVD